MKKLIAVIAVFAMMCSAASCSCAKKDVTAVSNYGSSDNGIYLKEDLSVESVDFDEFDTTKYDAEEYCGFLEEAAEEYNKTHTYDKRLDKDGNELDTVTGAVTVVKCEAADNMLETRILYNSAADMAEFMEENLETRGVTDMSSGLLEDAPDEVKNAVLVTPEGEAFDLEKAVAKNGSKYRYILCDAAALIYGDGDVAALSENGTYSKAYGCVEVPEGEKVIVLFTD